MMLFTLTMEITLIRLDSIISIGKKCENYWILGFNGLAYAWNVLDENPFISDILLK
jgi:hypothetical protein